ncbi:MAG: glycosyltransferase [Halieaceae bacterium]|nr:glycosyltransferase [Halieaceae bacterium]
METSTNRPRSLSVSIVLHNSPLKLFEQTLLSLYRSAEVAHEAGVVSELRVSIIDNSVDDHYREQIRELLSEWQASDYFYLEYSAASFNRGFGGGHNLKIERLTSDYHLILNPDTELANNALLVGLSLMDQDQSVALLSPRVIGRGGRQEFLCKRYPSVLVLALRGFAPSLVRRLFRGRLNHYEMHDECSSGEEVEVLLASGCYMLVRTVALRSAGGFSDEYFLYFEDFDLSLRIGRQGRKVFHPAMQIVHHGGYAASKGPLHMWLFFKSLIRFFNHHGWRWI